jgi:hypothetical protein
MEDLIEEGESDWEIIARTNFAQQWAREATETKQGQTEKELPRKYH